MKKQDLFTYLAYFLMIALALVVGFTVIRQALSDLSTRFTMGQVVGLSVGVLIGSLILHAAVFELARVIGAKIGGYEITKINILFFNFAKQSSGKWKFSFAGMDGLTGETVIVPKKDLKKEASPLPFLWFPTMLFAIQIIVIIFAIVQLDAYMKTSEGAIDLSAKIVTAILYIYVTLGGMLVLYDLFPTQLDTKNSGYFIRILNGNTNRHAFNLMLLADDETRKGLPVPKMDAFTDVTEFTGRLNILIAQENTKNGLFDDALIALDLVLLDGENNVSSYRTRTEALGEKIALLIFKKDIEKAREFFTEIADDRRQIITKDTSYDGLRRALLITAVLEESFAESLARYRAGRKIQARRIRDNGNNETTLDILFTKAIDLVKELRPEFDYDSSL